MVVSVGQELLPGLDTRRGGMSQSDSLTSTSPLDSTKLLLSIIQEDWSEVLETAIFLCLNFLKLDMEIMVSNSQDHWSKWIDTLEKYLVQNNSFVFLNCNW